MWTPLQDSLLGSRLTVPCHRVYNSRHPPQSPSDLPPKEGLRSEYVPSLGSTIVIVPSLEDQAAAGLHSIPLQPLHNQRTKRRRSRSRVRYEVEEELEEESCDPSAGRGRSTGRSPLITTDSF